MSVTYGQVEYERPSQTLREEDVGHEGRIARYLTENGIRYEREAFAQRNERVFRQIFAKPDFYLPDFGIYVEYWGLAHAGREYVQQMRRRMAVYNRHDIKFISLFPEDLGSSAWSFVRGLERLQGSSCLTPSHDSTSASAADVEPRQRLVRSFARSASGI